MKSAENPGSGSLRWKLFEIADECTPYNIVPSLLQQVDWSMHSPSVFHL